MLRGIDDYVLKIIRQKLEPLRYTENSFIIQKDEPLDKMLYVVDGFVSIKKRPFGSDDSRRGAGELCGEELLCWPFSIDFFNFHSKKPRAAEYVKAIGIVEALALNARDLKSIPTIQIQNMEESVLKELCHLLQSMKYYRNNAIIEKSDPIQMLLIVEGRIGYGGCVKGAGEIYGEELLVWPSLTFFLDRVPTAAESLFVITNVVEVLVLTASDMTSVATKFRKHFIKNYGRLVQNLSKRTFLRCFTEREVEEAIRNYTYHYYNNERYGTVYHTKLDGRGIHKKVQQC